MAVIYEDGNVSVHIEEGNEIPEAKCFDLRDDDMHTAIKIDLLTSFPYIVDLEEARITPRWDFVVETIKSVADPDNNFMLWAAWTYLNTLPPIP